MSIVEVYLSAALERLHQHAAAYVHSDDVRDDPVSKVAGEAYHAPGSGMYIRHYPNFAAAEYLDGHQLAELLYGLFLNVVREDFHIVIVNCSHIRSKVCYLQNNGKHVKNHGTSYEKILFIYLDQ